MEDAERLVADLDAARADRDRSTLDIDGRTDGLRRELADLSDAVAVKRDERLRVSKRVDPPTLSRYERILASKGDSAIADVTEGTCSGCRIKLPPQTVIEVRSGRRLMVCESCGRILFWQGERVRG
jgi:predicted  nucleic acid-binding Zn-ribbon protein